MNVKTTITKQLKLLINDIYQCYFVLLWCQIGFPCQKNIFQSRLRTINCARSHVSRCAILLWNAWLLSTFSEPNAIHCLSIQDDTWWWWSNGTCGLRVHWDRGDWPEQFVGAEQGLDGLRLVGALDVFVAVVGLGRVVLQCAVELLQSLHLAGGLGVRQPGCHGRVLQHLCGTDGHGRHPSVTTGHMHWLRHRVSFIFLRHFKVIDMWKRADNKQFGMEIHLEVFHMT